MLHQVGSHTSGLQALGAVTTRYLWTHIVGATDGLTILGSKITTQLAVIVDVDPYTEQLARLHWQPID